MALHPQVATVPEGGTGAATLTDHGVLLGSGAGAVTPTAALTDGQLLIGNSGNDPSVASLTAGTNITITPSAGGISIAAAASVAPYTTLANEFCTECYIPDDEHTFLGNAGTWGGVVEAGHPGVQYCASAECRIMTQDNGTLYTGVFYLGTGVTVYECLVKSGANLAGPPCYIYCGFWRCGGSDSDKNPYTYGGNYVLFKLQWDGTILAHTYDGTQTETDTGVSTGTGWHYLRIESNSDATEVKFYIDGSLEATHTTHIPSGSQDLHAGVGTNCNTVYVDMIAVNQTVTARW